MAVGESSVVEVCPELENVVSGWRSVIAVLVKVGSGASLISACTRKTEQTPYYASVIISYPRSVVPLNQIRLCRQLVVYVYGRHGVCVCVFQFS